MIVITYWSFEDPLIQTYTLPYLKIIKEVCPDEISIHLVTLEKELNKKNENTGNYNFLQNIYKLNYHPFGLRAARGWFRNILKLKNYIRKNQINTIHTWCTPAGMIGYILSKWLKLPLIADSFEPHAESMVENGTWRKDSTAFKILFFFEKKIAKNAEKIISIAPGMDKYIWEKYGIRRDCDFIKPACVNLEKFNLSLKKNPDMLMTYRLNDKIVCLYAGKFGGIYLDKEVFNFFAEAVKLLGEKIKFLILSNDSIDLIHEKIYEANLDPQQFIIKSVLHKEIQNWIGLADFALCPVKPVPTKKYCSPIKTGEYWAMGLPVIITDNISNDSGIINETGLGYVWKETSVSEYKLSIKKILFLLGNDKNILAERIRNLAVKNRNYNTAKDIYKKIYKQNIPNP